MKSEFEKNNQIELNRILNELYSNSNGILPKQKLVETEKRHIDYLQANQIITVLESNKLNTRFLIQLESIGYEIFEKYKGWDNYNKKILERTEKIEESKKTASLYWWLPVVISVFALIVSIFSLIFNLK